MVDAGNSSEMWGWLCVHRHLSLMSNKSGFGTQEGCWVSRFLELILSCFELYPLGHPLQIQDGDKHALLTFMAETDAFPQMWP